MDLFSRTIVARRIAELSNRVLVLAVVVAAGLTACQTPMTPEQIAAEQERARRRAELLAVTRDSRLDLLTRRDAARQLLASNQPEARRQLVNEINTTADPTSQQAIAQALAGIEPRPHDDFKLPLLGLLERADPEVPGLLADIAEALGRYEDNDLIRRLLDVAQDRKASIGYRRGATLTLGYARHQYVARVLIDLIKSDQPPPLRQAAFDALATLSGIDTFGADPAAWQRWWDDHRKLNRELFLERLLHNFARYNAREENREQQMQSRLVEAQRALYRAASADDRARLLAQMLTDDLAATRQLAMDLMLQRLIDNEPMTAGLKQALLTRLDDPVPVMRQRAALLLRETRDDRAADVVADKLVAGAETQTAVRQAYLLVMARSPRPQAIEPALSMLAQPELTAEAAAVLAAASEASMLTPEQARQAAATVRKQLGTDALPRPQVITLLGRVGDDNDFRRIEAWLEASDPTVKQAAAQAWANSERPLAPLAQRADDPVIRDIVIDAATRRGNDSQTLFALIENKPVQDQVAAAWRRALVAMARRVSARTAIDADRRLAEMGEPAATREPFLNAALERYDGVVSTDPLVVSFPTTTSSAQNDLVELLLSRAETRLATDPALSVADYQRIEATRHPLSPAQRERFDRGLLQARLATGQIAGAFELARKIIGNNPTPRADTTDADRIVGWFLDHAQRSATNGQPEQARSMLAQLRALFSGAVSPSTAKRISDLEAALPPERAAGG